MSDGPSRSRSTSARTKRKRAPRGGRYGLTRPAPPPAMDVQPLAEPATVVAAPVRSRRSARSVAPRPAGITREAEMAYIRADMRRLVIIAGVLLLLMVVLLLVLER